jgi:hypothetical protein
MQLAGVRLKPRNRLHQKALRHVWELRKRTEAAKLKVLVLAAFKKSEEGVKAFEEYLDLEFPYRQESRKAWQNAAEDLLSRFVK